MKKVNTMEELNSIEKIITVIKESGDGKIQAADGGSLVEVANELQQYGLVPAEMGTEVLGGFRITELTYTATEEELNAVLKAATKPSDEEISRFRMIKLAADKASADLKTVKEELKVYASDESGTIKFMNSMDNLGLSITTAITPQYNKEELITHLTKTDPKNKTGWKKIDVDVKKVDATILEGFAIKPKVAFTFKTI